MGRKTEGLALMKDRTAQITAFLGHSGWLDASRIRVAGDASNRTYDRLTKANGATAILMDAPPERGEDVRPFVAIANHLRSAGLSTPEIYHQDETAGLLLIEDFGDNLFADLMAADTTSQDPLYRAAADVLLALRSVPKPELTVCDAHWLISMLDPVFEWYATDATPAIVDDFKTQFTPFATNAAKTETVIMLRDFHVQNLLLLPNRAGVQKVGILDFQDAMLAHPAYDLVSILQDARRDVSAGIEQDILSYYLSQTSIDAMTFGTDYATFGLQRNLRILGIFARLSRRDGKAHYVDLIPRVWGYVMRNLAHPALTSLAPTLTAILPEPTPSHLEQLKYQCPPNTPS